MHRVFRTILGTACSERPRTEAGLDSASDAVVLRPHASPCILAEDSSATVAPVASQAPVILALRCGFMVVALSPAQRMCGAHGMLSGTFIAQRGMRNTIARLVQDAYCCYTFDNSVSPAQLALCTNARTSCAWLADRSYRFLMFLILAHPWALW